MRYSFCSFAREKMATANPFDEIFNSEIDERAISALVGSLESQLASPTSKDPLQQNSTSAVNNNHINSTQVSGTVTSISQTDITGGQKAGSVAHTASQIVTINSNGSKITTSSPQLLGINSLVNPAAVPGGGVSLLAGLGASSTVAGGGTTVVSLQPSFTTAAGLVTTASGSLGNATIKVDNNVSQVSTPVVVPVGSNNTGTIPLNVKPINRVQTVKMNINGKDITDATNTTGQGSIASSAIYNLASIAAEQQPLAVPPGGHPLVTQRLAVPTLTVREQLEQQKDIKPTVTITGSNTSVPKPQFVVKQEAPKPQVQIKQDVKPVVVTSAIMSQPQTIVNMVNAAMKGTSAAGTVPVTSVITINKQVTSHQPGLTVVRPTSTTTSGAQIQIVTTPRFSGAGLTQPKTLAPRIINTPVRIAAAPQSTQVVASRGTMGTITLPAGFQLPPGTVLMKNEQGQIVVMQQGTLQPQHNSSTIPGTAQYKLHKVQHQTVTTAQVGQTRTSPAVQTMVTVPQSKGQAVVRMPIASSVSTATTASPAASITVTSVRPGMPVQTVVQAPRTTAAAMTTQVAAPLGDRVVGGRPHPMGMRPPMGPHHPYHPPYYHSPHHHHLHHHHQQQHHHHQHHHHQQQPSSRQQQPHPPSPLSPSPPQPPPQGALPTPVPMNTNMLENVKKCKNFLSTLIKLASGQPANTVKNVKELIQGLIDNRVEPEAFTEQLQVELKSSPQPYLVPFLKKSLPLLRQSLCMNKMHIDGVRPPPTSVLQQQAVSISTVTMAPQTTTQMSSPHTTTVKQVKQKSGTIQTSIRQLTPQQAQQLQLLQQQHGIKIPAHQAKSLLAGKPLGTVAGAAPATVSALQSHVQVGKPQIIVNKQVGGTQHLVQHKEKRKYESVREDDDINDVATMGGVNLTEESRNILATNSELVATPMRSCKDENFLKSKPLAARLKAIASKHGLDDMPQDVINLISHATQERLRNIAAKLATVAEHRLEVYKTDARYEVTNDVKAQLKFLEELDRLEKKRHEEQEREVLLRAAKSRSKHEDPEQLKLKQKAKELQQAEMEEMRQREANLTALAAIGPRKKRKTEGPDFGQSGSGAGASSSSGTPGSSSSASRPSMLRPRIKRVNLRDLIFLLEQERETAKSNLLYKSFLK